MVNIISNPGYKYQYHKSFGVGWPSGLWRIPDREI